MLENNNNNKMQLRDFWFTMTFTKPEQQFYYKMQKSLQFQVTFEKF